MKPSISSRISCVLGIGNGFLQIQWFSFLKQDQNLPVPLFFGWIKVRDPHSDTFSFLSTPSLQSLYTSFLKKIPYALVGGYCFVWYVLASGCIYIYVGLVLQVPNVLSKSNSYLVHISWSISCSSPIKCLIYDATLCRSAFSLWSYKMVRVCHMESSICLLSHSS